ncbi:hypothetical protein, partial [Klebsiella pneumoniae]|uniref:hypothetical protein n=1 Tax=Klebsiella pneumoniae TaxID=573 RepID=UPI00202E413A
ALSSAFSGMGGGGVWGSLASAAFGGTKAATPSFDGGGFTGLGSRSGGIDGKGGFPAILHPNETVLDHTKGQRFGSNSINLVGDVRGATGNQEVQRMVAIGVQQGMAQVRREVPSIMDNHQKRRG